MLALKCTYVLLGIPFESKFKDEIYYSNDNEYVENVKCCQDLTCKQCVLQWKYFAANSWGKNFNFMYLHSIFFFKKLKKDYTLEKQILCNSANVLHTPFHVTPINKPFLDLSQHDKVKEFQPIKKSIYPLLFLYCKVSLRNSTCILTNRQKYL